MTTTYTTRQRPAAVAAADLTFGVELETICSTRPEHGVGGYHRGRTVREFIDAGVTGWKAENDSSLGCGGIEFVSPKLQGPAGLDSVRTVCETIKNRFGGRVDRSCGVHVHIGFPTDDIKALQRLIRIVAHFEEALFATTGNAHRENSGWCRSIKTPTNRGTCWKSKKSIGDISGSRDHSHGQRYHSLNLTPLLYGTRPAVEFRIFTGSLNPSKIAAWVQVCLSLVQAALTEKRVRSWDAKTDGDLYHRNASGESEARVNHLFYRLGWTSGQCNISGLGDLGHDFYTIDRAKRTLREQARRHDGNTRRPGQRRAD